MKAGDRCRRARTTRIVARLALFFAHGLGAAGCGADAPEPWTLQGETMGTTWRVRIPPAAASEDRRAAWQEGIQDVLDRVNAEMSTYLEASEISRFNRAAKGEWFPVSPTVAGVIETAMAIGRASEGAFDVTVGPLVDLWGFGAGSEGPDRVPTDAEIEAALEKVGIRNIAIRREPLAVRKSVEGLELDLSAIAKGHGVDRVAQYLDGQGVSAYLIEVGGEIRTRGERAPGQAWRVAIEKPTPAGRAVHRLLQLRDIAMATSGDYRNFFEADGKSYSHTIDPKTGRPVRHALTSTTVLADTCELADAWATALTVLGPERGYQLAVERDLAALLLVRTPEGIEERTTPAFERMFP